MDLPTAQPEALPHIECDNVAECDYVLDCVRTSDPHAAVWAPQRGDDACDLAVQLSMDVTMYAAEIEIALLTGPAVQSELALQASDIADLQQNPEAASTIVIGHASRWQKG